MKALERVQRSYPPDPEVVAEEAYARYVAGWEHDRDLAWLDHEADVSTGYADPKDRSLWEADYEPDLLTFDDWCEREADDAYDAHMTAIHYDA